MFGKRSVLHLLLAFVILGSYLLVIPSLASAQASPLVCKFPFEATVRQGKSSGTSVIGDMTLNIAADGSFTGQVVEKDGTSVPVSGQVTGRAISLVMELKPMADKTPGSYVFGTGAALNPIMGDADCGGPLGGTFAGPGVDDIGSWIKVEACVTVNGTRYCASVEVTL